MSGSFKSHPIQLDFFLISVNIRRMYFMQFFAAKALRRKVKRWKGRKGKL